MTPAFLVVILCGWYNMLLAVFHLLFWTIFGWKTELKKLNPANRGIMQILNIRIIYIFLFVAFLCFFFTPYMAETVLGRAILGGMTLFWLGRLIEQFIFFSHRHWQITVLSMLFLVGIFLHGILLFF